MKLLSLVTVVVLLQVPLISQAADMDKLAMQEQSSPTQIQAADKTNIITNVPAAVSNVINTEIGLEAIGVKKLTKTDWGTTITKRKLHLRDGVFSLTLHSTKLYS